MADQNVFKIRKTLRDVLEDKFSDALTDPKQTLLDVPYEHLSLLLQKIHPSEYEFLSEEVDKDNQALYEVFVAAEALVGDISARMNGFSVETLNKKADAYFKELDLPTETDAGQRDLSDLKRFVKGHLGNFFDTAKPVKHFIAGDIMERYFDDCLLEFKKSRSEEFDELFLKKIKVA